MTDNQSRGTEISQTRAHQAVTGHNVRYVLIFGVALVAIAFLAVALLVKP